MKMKYWSDYEKYIVLADRSGVLKSGYLAYLDFIKVKEALRKIANTEKNLYYYDETYYDKKISHTDAQNILRNISECIWNTTTEKIRTIAIQLGVSI